MESFLEFQTTAVRMLFAQTETMVDSWATISMRIPVLIEDGLRGQISSETQAMVSEKVIATTEGAIGASQAGARLALNFLSGRLYSRDVPHRLMHVMDAAAKPARKRVRSNALRLTGRRDQAARSMNI
ncbi:MAG: hypothetical protein KGQ37_11960 [Hyphomicrobiales bacterium]|nr:hypothetical protein [Hyphomicrobiales bacterium]